MKKNKTWMMVVGFLLAGLGFLAVFLSLVGLRFSFLAWIDAFGALPGFLIRIGMILGGFILIYLAQLDVEEG